MILRWSWLFILRVGFVRADYSVWDSSWEAIAPPPSSARLTRRTSSNNSGLILALVGSLTLLLVLIAVIVVIRSRAHSRTSEDPESGIRVDMTSPVNTSDVHPPPVPRKPLLRSGSKRLTELRTTRYVPPTPSPTTYADRPLPPLPAGATTPRNTEFGSRTTSQYFPRQSSTVITPSLLASRSLDMRGGQHRSRSEVTPNLGTAVKQSHSNVATRGGITRKSSHAPSNSRGSFLSLSDSEPTIETTDGSYTAYQSGTTSVKDSSAGNSTTEASYKTPRLGIPRTPRPKKTPSNQSREALAAKSPQLPNLSLTTTSWLVNDPLTSGLRACDVSQEATSAPQSEYASQTSSPTREPRLSIAITPGLRLPRTRRAKLSNKHQPRSRQSSSAHTNMVSPADSADIIGELDKLKTLIAESGRSQIVRPPTFVGRLEGN